MSLGPPLRDATSAAHPASLILHPLPLITARLRLTSHEQTTVGAVALGLYDETVG